MNKKVLFGGVIALMLLSGCATTQPKSTIAKVTDSCIVGDIKITDIKGGKREDGLMRTQIEGENLSGSYKQLEYKIVWLDDDGFVIKSILSNWRKFSAEANQPFYITNIAPNAKASDFRLYIREDNEEKICKR